MEKIRATCNWLASAVRKAHSERSCQSICSIDASHQQNEARENRERRARWDAQRAEQCLEIARQALAHAERILGSGWGASTT